MHGGLRRQARAQGVEARLAGIETDPLTEQAVARQALTLAFEEVFLRLALLFLRAIPLAAP